MRRQETAASICEDRRVIFLPNLPIIYMQNDIPGSSIKPDGETRNFLQAGHICNIIKSYSVTLKFPLNCPCKFSDLLNGSGYRHRCPGADLHLGYNGVFIASVGQFGNCKLSHASTATAVSRTGQPRQMAAATSTLAASVCNSLHGV
jgi:hypothetical protein